MRKYRNRNTPWKEEDIWLLSKLMQDGISLSTISVVLGRTENGIRHAIKNTLYQQLLYHMPSEILESYRMDESHLYTRIVSPKYYQPVCAPDQASAMATEDEDEDTDEPAFSYAKIFLPAFGSLVLAGMGYYIMTLSENWVTISTP